MKVRSLSADFLNPFAIPECDDFARDLRDLAVGDRQYLRLSPGFLKVAVVEEVGTDSVEHDERGRDGLVAAWKALCQRDHENLQCHKAALGGDGRIEVRLLAHAFFAFSPSFRMEARS